METTRRALLRCSVAAVVVPVPAVASTRLRDAVERYLRAEDAEDAFYKASGLGDMLVSHPDYHRLDEQHAVLSEAYVDRFDEAMATPCETMDDLALKVRAVRRYVGDDCRFLLESNQLGPLLEDIERLAREQSS